MENSLKVITIEKLEIDYSDGRIERVDEEQIALIQYSSGSTSTPKGGTY